MPTLRGQVLMTGQTGHTSWRAAPGEAATLSVDVLVSENATALGVVVETKNADELDTSAVSATDGSFSITAAGVTSQRVTGVKQLVRIKVTATSENLEDEEYVRFRILQILWERN